jgi:hypothetical protein
MVDNVQQLRSDARPVLSWPSIAAASAALRSPRTPRDEREERAVVLPVRPAGDAAGHVVAATTIDGLGGSDDEVRPHAA